MCAHGTTLFHMYIFSLFSHEHHHLKNTHQHAMMDATEHTTLSSSQNIKEEYV
jgi:hypothetical protein